MTVSTDANKPPVVAAIGEALFDCFVNRTMLGGAPVNFIAHMRQLLEHSNGQAIIISRVGDDELGRQLIREVGSRGVSTEFIQVDPNRQTGQVQVDVSTSGDPKYHITESVAWDYIACDESLERLATSCSAVCFGTLAQRSATSREATHKFLANAKSALRVLDVNLRQHYFTSQIIESSLAAANVVKLNEEELASLSTLLPGRIGNANTIDEQVRALIDVFGLIALALTRGPKGTVLYGTEGRHELEPLAFPAAADADSVGAGDACCAGLVYGMLMKWPIDRTLELANRLGAFVASQPGGTPRLPRELLDFVA